MPIPPTITMKVVTIITIFAFTLSAQMTKLPSEPACRTRCGSLDLKYPFGSGHGCGSPRFHPHVTCSGDGAQLRLTTHAASYPITSISYADATVAVLPLTLSNCTALRLSPPAPAFALDWTGPFRLADSAFILFACSSVPPDGICDPSSAYLCPSLYTCPAVAPLGLEAENTCCVYAPANLQGSNDELDLRQLGCAGYSSVVALGDVPTEPELWRYGVSLKYTMGGMDGYDTPPGCRGCELSNGVCGYAPPGNSFVCVCGYGNTTSDCNGYGWLVATSSPSSSSTGYWKLLIAAIWVFIVAI